MAIDSIPLTHSARNTATVVEDIPVERITASALNPRKIFDQDRLEELAESLKQHGMIEPIVVRTVHRQRPEASGIAWFEIIAGERRWRAAKLAGLETVPTRILGQVDDETALQLALIENLQRQDLDPIEEAEGYHLLNHIVGMKQKEIAESVNRSQPAIANAMRLLELPADVQERIRAGELSRSHGVALAKYKNFPALVSKLAEMAATGRMTSHDLEKNVLSDYRLEAAGLVKRIWLSSFDRSACKECPFGAYVTEDYSEYCLNPAHYAELEAEQIAAATAENEARVQAAKDAGESLPHIADLERDGYEVIFHSVEGCSPECPCRTVALDASGSMKPICLDPPRRRTLYQEERARDDERRAAIKEHYRKQLKDAISDLEVDSRAMAVMAVLVLSREWDLTKTPIGRHLPAPLTPKTEFGYQIATATMDALAQMEPAALLAMVLDVALSSKIRDRDIDLVLHWYLGDLPDELRKEAGE